MSVIFLTKKKIVDKYWNRTFLKLIDICGLRPDMIFF